MATVNAISDRTPSTIPGVTCLKGNKNPVTLVSTVVVRKIAVQLSRRLLASSPARTTRPEPIPIRLRITWIAV
jgi:hypothetical protein